MEAAELASWREAQGTGGETLGAGKGLAACVASVVALNKELKESTGIKSMHGDFFFPSGDFISSWNLFQLS